MILKFSYNCKFGCYHFFPQYSFKVKYNLPLMTQILSVVFDKF